MLRKCSKCGLEAHTKAELEQFTTCRPCKHGKRNLCKACNNARNKEYYQDHRETRLQNFKAWREANPNYMKEHNKKWRLQNIEHLKTYEKERGLRTIRFKGKPIRYQENPRTNICQLCKRKYPEELKRQTCIHHVIYNEKDPLAWTLELCISCHMKIHNTNRKHNSSSHAARTNKTLKDGILGKSSVIFGFLSLWTLIVSLMLKVLIL